MARLRQGEKKQIEESIHALLHQHDNGLWESEVADINGMDRRRVNNYLRKLEEDDKAYKDGRAWFAR